MSSICLRCMATMFLLVVFGCGGIKFNDAAINRTLPEIWKTRTIYPDIEPAYHPDQFIGGILEEREIPDPKTGKIKKEYKLVARIWPDNYEFKPNIITKPDSARYYKSKIDFQASIQGSFLEYLTGNFSAEQMAEIQIYDTMDAYIDIGHIDEVIEKYNKWKQTHPMPPGVKRRLWVRTFSLSPYTYSDYVIISANADAVVGETVGAKGRVYRKEETTLKFPVIGMITHDMETMTIYLRAKRPIREVLEDSRYTTIIRNRIE